MPWQDILVKALGGAGSLSALGAGVSILWDRLVVKPDERCQAEKLALQTKLDTALAEVLKLTSESSRLLGKYERECGKSSSVPPRSI